MSPSTSNASVKQERKRDWAFLGGLAEGIAGTGAGIAVAASISSDNAEIERRLGEIRTAQLEAVNGDIARLSQSIQAVNGQLTASEQYQKQYADAEYEASKSVLKWKERSMLKRF